MDVRTIIDQLGGSYAVARLFGINGAAVSQWAAKGRIPAERVPSLERRARELGLPLRAEVMRPDVDWAALRDA